MPFYLCRVGGGTKIKSATKVYENYTQNKTAHTFTAQKGRTYIITIHEFNGTSNVKADYTGCEVLYSEKSLMNTSYYSTVLFAAVVATGTSVTITMSGGIDYQSTIVYELN
ncbi:hypothetical protein ACTNE0_07685 [Bacillota bacterium HCP3S3_E9]